jgi:hypothetical protein
VNQYDDAGLNCRHDPPIPQEEGDVMTSSAAENSQGVGDPEAFAFVQALAAELSKGKVDLPSFPDIALKVRRVLADEEVSQEKVVRVVGSEPALAARLMQIANSAAINFTGSRSPSCAAPSPAWASTWCAAPPSRSRCRS